MLVALPTASRHLVKLCILLGQGILTIRQLAVSFWALVDRTMTGWLKQPAGRAGSL